MLAVHLPAPQRRLRAPIPNMGHPVVWLHPDFDLDCFRAPGIALDFLFIHDISFLFLASNTVGNIAEVLALGVDTFLEESYEGRSRFGNLASDGCKYIPSSFRVC